MSSSRHETNLDHAIRYTVEIVVRYHGFRPQGQIMGCILAAQGGYVYVVACSSDLNNAIVESSFIRRVESRNSREQYPFDVVSPPTATDIVLLRANMPYHGSQIPRIAPCDQLVHGAALVSCYKDRERLARVHGRCVEIVTARMRDTTDPATVRRGAAVTCLRLPDGASGAPVFNPGGEFEGMVIMSEREGNVTMLTVRSLHYFLHVDPRSRIGQLRDFYTSNSDRVFVVTDGDAVPEAARLNGPDRYAAPQRRRSQRSSTSAAQQQARPRRKKRAKRSSGGCTVL